MRHNAFSDLERQSGEFPGPLDEVQLWETRLEKLHSINVQLDSPVAQDILRNLEEASSSYATSFQNVRKDINKVSFMCFIKNVIDLYITSIFLRNQYFASVSKRNLKNEF